MSVSLPHAISVWQRNAALYRRTWRMNILPNFFDLELEPRKLSKQRLVD